MLEKDSCFSSTDLIEVGWAEDGHDGGSCELMSHCRRNIQDIRMGLCLRELQYFDSDSSIQGDVR
jgi:hypothetical protein